MPGISLGARAPLMSHATARPRQAGTSFESQATSATGSGYENQPNRDLSTLRPRLTTIPARPAAPTHNWADIARPSRGPRSRLVTKVAISRQPHSRLVAALTRRVVSDLGAKRERRGAARGGQTRW